MGGLGYIVLAVIVWWLYKRYFTVTVRKNQEAALAIRSFHSKVVGVTFNNPDGTSRQKLISKHGRAGQSLTLTPEPDNPKDPNAVAILAPYGQIGYVEGGRLAEDISRHLRTGNKVNAEITEITGGSGKHPTRGVNITIHIHQ